MSTPLPAPRVSVVIPVFNGARYLGEAIASALSQTGAALEVVVIDDGSTDGSVAVATAFGPPVRAVAAAHAGVGAARNRGVREARGEVIAFLDADDVWLPGSLSCRLAALDGDDALDVAFGHIENFISPDLGDAERARLRCPPGAMPGYIPQASLIRRRAFDLVGPFDESRTRGEFIDWYMRAVELGVRSTLVPEVVVRRRLHADNQGIREREAAVDYVRVVRAALARRRASGREGD